MNFYIFYTFLERLNLSFLYLKKHYVVKLIQVDIIENANETLENMKT